MNRTMLLAYLERSQRHVAEAETHVANLRELVADLERDGQPSAELKRLLVNFEDTLKTRLGNLQWVADQLEQSGWSLDEG